jgi:hypothetical protein
LGNASTKTAFKAKNSLTNYQSDDDDSVVTILPQRLEQRDKYLNFTKQSHSASKLAGLSPFYRDRLKDDSNLVPPLKGRSFLTRPTPLAKSVQRPTTALNKKS